MRTERDKRALIFAMSLSFAVGILMLVIKLGAYLLTGSAAILSDAAESVVHVAAVSFATYSLKLSHKPADETHPYGHAKISFFSAGFEGSMIVIAAIYIIYESLSQWFSGLTLKNLGIGTALTALAAVMNGGLGLYLVKIGKKKKSIVLEANGKHVLTDSWTSIGVLIGLGFTLVTGWLPWDPIFAILVAFNILYSGIGLIRRGVTGLMDEADPDIHKKLIETLEKETSSRGIFYHRVRHRNVGDLHWVEFHLLFPQATSIREAHKKATEIEKVISDTLEPGARVTTHLEAIEDHAKVHGDVDH